MLIHHWHNILSMPRKDLDWHKQDIKDELIEWQEAKGFVASWSELSDVAYTYTRAKWDGFSLPPPLKPFLLFLGYWYMIPKYTLRWFFYYSIGKQLNSPIKVTEVRNPLKAHKLDHIANKYDLDPETFRQAVAQKSKRWFFLK